MILDWTFQESRRKDDWKGGCAEYSPIEYSYFSIREEEKKTERVSKMTPPPHQGEG